MAEENHMLRKLATGVLPSQINTYLIVTQQFLSHKGEVRTCFYEQVGDLERQEDVFLKEMDKLTRHRYQSKARSEKKKFTSSDTVPFRSGRLDFRFSPIYLFPSYSSWS